MRGAYILKYPYISVGDSYGGSQSWFANSRMNQGGCGVVAAGDVLLYLGLYRRGCRTEEMNGLFCGPGCVSRFHYEKYLGELRRRYFPLLPKLGMPYWVLILGLNRYFHKHGIRLKARWGVAPWNMRKRIQELLMRNLPVILSVGPNFPLFFLNRKLKLYEKDQAGTYRHVTQTRAHYVVCTGMEDGKLRISSWGKKYYIDWEEYRAYAAGYSNYLMSNICFLREV